MGDDYNTEIVDTVPDLEDFTGWISPHFEGDTLKTKSQDSAVNARIEMLRQVAWTVEERYSV